MKRERFSVKGSKIGAILSAICGLAFVIAEIYNFIKNWEIGLKTFIICCPLALMGFSQAIESTEELKIIDEKIIYKRFLLKKEINITDLTKIECYKYKNNYRMIGYIEKVKAFKITIWGEFEKCEFEEVIKEYNPGVVSGTGSNDIEEKNKKN